MTFKEALKELNIEDYEERIFNSNSQGELFHLSDYIDIANILKDKSKFKEKFREWFILVIKDAEENWERPESIFQYIPRIMFNK